MSPTDLGTDSVPENQRKQGTEPRVALPCGAAPEAAGRPSRLGRQACSTRRRHGRTVRAAPTTSSLVTLPPGPEQGSGEVLMSDSKHDVRAGHDGARRAQNVSLALRCAGPLDVAALDRAFADAVERHEKGWADPPVLRTNEALGDFDSAIRDALAEPIDLAVGPPVRAHLFAAGPERHMLVLVAHRTLADERSLRLLWRDLAHAYEARTAGSSPDWSAIDETEPRQSYGEPEGEHGMADHLAYWKTQLNGVPEQLSLPADRPRPAEPSYRADRIPVRIGARSHARLAELAEASDASLLMVLHAGLAALLSRMGAGDDIVMGQPTPGSVHAPDLSAGARGNALWCGPTPPAARRCPGSCSVYGT
ncbi:hypothetical protein E4K10_48145 [Streptomyces sp. T1317-0309]|nr:hypothetical protein E4K10_48145 [Streptomyces sp. T1317-0309]